MGFANLNVCISERDPCTISLEDWSVLVTDCSGHPISWCEPTVGGPNLKHGSPFPAPVRSRRYQNPTRLLCCLGNPLAVYPPLQIPSSSFYRLVRRHDGMRRKRLCTSLSAFGSPASAVDYGCRVAASRKGDNSRATKLKGYARL